MARRLASPATLSAALTGRSRMPWRSWISAELQDAAEGVRSLERHYVDGVERAHGLPAGSAAG